MKLTEWYPHYIKPVNPGYYETRVYGYVSKFNWYWTGSRWDFYSPYETGVENKPAQCQKREWRGLREQAK